MKENNISFDKFASISLLFDFYGNMLPERQRQAVELYYEENLSLAEIADEFKISRQGVHDALKNAEKALNEYENKLGLIERFQDTQQKIMLVDKKLEKILDDNKESSILNQELQEIKDIIDKIE